MTSASHPLGVRQEETDWDRFMLAQSRGLVSKPGPFPVTGRFQYNQQADFLNSGRKPVPETSWKESPALVGNRKGASLAFAIQPGWGQLVQLFLCSGFGGSQL